MYNGNFVQDKKVIEIAVPKSWASTACTAEWVNMAKISGRLVYLIQTGAWAGGTAAVSLNQATSDGGSAATVTLTKYWTVSGDTVTAATVSSNTFNLSAASTMYIVEVTPEMLTRASSYDWVRLVIASPGANADFYSVTAIAEGLKHTAAVSVLT